MGIKSERPIYRLIETRLKASTVPVTCSELMEETAIRKEAIAEFGGSDKDVQLATNKLSDVLGFMWRKGYLTRYPAPAGSTSFARYAYMWAERRVAPPQPVASPVRLTKQSFNIIEHEDGVAIEFDKFVVFIRPKT